MRLLTAALAWLLFSACSVTARHADDPRMTVRGPAPTRVQQPNKLTFLAFRPRQAVAHEEGAPALRITSAYSSIFENGHDVTEQVVLDGEIWRNSFAMTWGVAPRTDLEVELSLVFATSGFLDEFVEAWHDLFGLPDGGRDERPQYAYEMTEVKDGNEIYCLTGDQLGFGDVPVVITHQIVVESEDSPAVAVRAGIDIPLGSEDKGFGNGALDWGGGVLAQKSWGRWTTTAAVDYVFTAEPSAFEDAGIDAEDDLGLQWGLEYRWNDASSLLAGVVYSSPVTRDFDLKELDRETASVNVGMAFDLPGPSTLVVGFEDDVVAESGPDFTVFASWSVGL